MDFIFVLVFLLVVSSVVYQRLVGGAGKEAVAGKRPPFEDIGRQVPDELPDVEQEVPPCTVLDEIVRPLQKEKQHEEQVAGKKPDVVEKHIHPAALKDVSEARRAFIYSEIFRRKYE